MAPGATEVARQAVVLTVGAVTTIAGAEGLAAGVDGPFDYDPLCCIEPDNAAATASCAAATIKVVGTIRSRGGGGETYNGGTVKIRYRNAAPDTSGISSGRIDVQKY